MSEVSRTKITETMANSKEKPHLNLVCVGHVDAGLYILIYLNLFFENLFYFYFR